MKTSLDDDKDLEDVSLISQDDPNQYTFFSLQNHPIHVIYSIWVILLLISIITLPGFSLLQQNSTISSENRDSGFIKASIQVNNFPQNNFFLQVDLCSQNRQEFNASTTLNLYTQNYDNYQFGFIHNNLTLTPVQKDSNCCILYRNNSLSITSFDFTVLIYGDNIFLQGIHLIITTFTTRFLYLMKILNFFLIIISFAYIFFIFFKIYNTDENKTTHITNLAIAAFGLVMQLTLPQNFDFSKSKQIIHDFCYNCMLTVLLVFKNSYGNIFFIIPFVGIIIFIISDNFNFDFGTLYSVLLSLIYSISLSQQIKFIVIIFSTIRICIHILIALIVTPTLCSTFPFIKPVFNWFFTFLLLNSFYE